MVLCGTVSVRTYMNRLCVAATDGRRAHVAVLKDCEGSVEGTYKIIQNSKRKVVAVLAPECLYPVWEQAINIDGDIPARVFSVPRAGGKEYKIMPFRLFCEVHAIACATVNPEYLLAIAAGFAGKSMHMRQESNIGILGITDTADRNEFNRLAVLMPTR